MPLRIYPIYILLQLLLGIVTLTSNAQSWQWAVNAGGPGRDQASAIDVDAAGNSYITGSFQDSIAFGAVVLHSPGTSLFITKYSSAGNLVWARLAAAGTSMSVTGISVDKAGNPAIIGLFSGAASFGSTGSVSITASAGYDVFTASYTASGAIRWARGTGGPGYDYGSGISRDGLGNIYITGEIHLTSFNGSSSKIFVARYDTAGNNAWLDSSLNYSVGTYAQGIRTDSLGNSYIIGAYFNHLTFDADSAVAVNAGNIESNIYIGKLSSSGEALWLQTAGAGSGYTGGNAIDIDAAGNAYITGNFHGTISFGALSLAGQFGTASEPFLAKCNAGNGAFLWAKKPTGPAGAYHISTDASGNSYITGTFSSTITFGSTTLTNTGGADIYIAKANSAGSFLWATQCGGATGMPPGDLKSRGNSIYIAGGFQNTIHFGNADSLVALGPNSDVFLARLVDKTLIVEEPSTVVYTLYPNPANDQLNVKGPTDNKTYIIYDATGRAVSKGTFSNTSTIQTSTLPSGTYILSIHSQTGQPVHLRFARY